MPQCKANYCNVQRGQGISTYAIPDPVKKKQLYERWIHNLGSEKLNIENYVYSQNRIVCEKHFEKSCFIENKQAKMLGYTPRRKLLKPDAVPTIFEECNGRTQRNLNKKRLADKNHSEMLLDKLPSTDVEATSSCGALDQGSVKGKRALDQGSAKGKRALDQGLVKGKCALNQGSAKGKRALDQGSVKGKRVLDQVSLKGKRPLKKSDKIVMKKSKTMKSTTDSRSIYILSQPSNDSDHSYSIQSGHIGPNEPSPDYLRKFDAVICDFLREQGVPGATLFMSYMGKPVYQQGYGISECGVPMSSSSYLRIASISKVFTAIAILRLCDEGRLQLDQLVFGEEGILNRIKPDRVIHREYLCITVRHLLEHSAGWDRERVGDHVFWYADMKHTSYIRVGDNEQILRYVLTKKLSFKPGTKHAYSNLGYLILGLIVEHITSLDYEVYVKSILRELDIDDVYVGKDTQEKVHYMETKYYNNSEPAVEKFACDWRSLKPNYVPTQYGSFPMESSASYGGWVTCAQSLVTILDHLYYEAGKASCVLSKRSIKDMFKAPQFAQGEAWYGLGIDLEDNGKGFGHTGAMEGTTTTVHHSAKGYTWALLLNAWAKDSDLDGMIKYALSAVWNTNHVLNDYEVNENNLTHEERECDETLNMQESDKEVKDDTSKTCFKESEEYFLTSEDGQECVQILLPHNQLLSHVGVMKERGYRIHIIDALTVDKDVLFNIVWRKCSNNKDWFVLLDVEIQNMQMDTRLFKEGWKFVHLQNYIDENKIKHLFVVEKCKDPHYQQKFHCNLNITEHKRIMVENDDEGYQLKTQCTIWLHDQHYISALFERKTSGNVNYTDTQVWYELSIENYVKALGEKVRGGLHLEDFHLYSVNSEPRISAVWRKCLALEGVENNVFQRHDVSKYGFLIEMSETLADNLPVKFLSAYVHDGVINFAAVWDIQSRKSRTRECTEPLIQYENADMSVFQESLLGQVQSVKLTKSNRKLKRKSKHKQVKSVHNKPKSLNLKSKPADLRKHKATHGSVTGIISDLKCNNPRHMLEILTKD